MKENSLKVFKSFIAFIMSLVLVVSTSFCVVFAVEPDFNNNYDISSYFDDDDFFHVIYNGVDYSSPFKYSSNSFSGSVSSTPLTWTDSYYIISQPTLFSDILSNVSGRVNFALFFDIVYHEFCFVYFKVGSTSLTVPSSFFFNIVNNNMSYFSVISPRYTSSFSFSAYFYDSSSYLGYNSYSTSYGGSPVVNNYPSLSYFHSDSFMIPVYGVNEFFGYFSNDGQDSLINVPAEFKYNYIFFDPSTNFYTFLTWEHKYGRFFGNTFYSADPDKGAFKLYYSFDGKTWTLFSFGYSGTITYSSQYMSDFDYQLIYQDSNFGKGGTSYVEFEDSEYDIPENPDLSDIIESIHGSNPDDFIYHGSYDVMISCPEYIYNHLSLNDLSNSTKRIYVYKAYEIPVVFGQNIVNFDQVRDNLSALGYNENDSLIIYSNSSSLARTNVLDSYIFDAAIPNDSSITLPIYGSFSVGLTLTSVNHHFYIVFEQISSFVSTLGSNLVSLDNFSAFVNAFDLYQAAELGKFDSLYTRLGTVNKNIGGLLSTLTTIDQSIKSINFDDSDIIDAINNIQVTVPSSDSEVSLVDDQFTQLLDAIEESASDSVGITDDQINTITDAIQDNSGLTSLQYAGLLNAINGINAPDYAPDYDPDYDPNVPWWSFVTSGLTGAAAGTVFGTLESYFNDEYFGGQLLAGMGFVGDSMQRFFETVPAAQPILIGGCVFLVADVVLRKNGV